MFERACAFCKFEERGYKTSPCNMCISMKYHPMFRPKESGTVNHPSHYNQGNVECIDAIKAATVGLNGIEAFCAGNAIKYLWRWKEKGGVTDLDKAAFYIERLKKELVEESEDEDA